MDDAECIQKRHKHQEFCKRLLVCLYLPLLSTSTFIIGFLLKGAPFGTLPLALSQDGVSRASNASVDLSVPLPLPSADQVNESANASTELSFESKPRPRRKKKGRRPSVTDALLAVSETPPGASPVGSTGGAAPSQDRQTTGDTSIAEASVSAAPPAKKKKKGKKRAAARLRATSDPTADPAAVQEDGEALRAPSEGRFETHSISSEDTESGMSL